MTRLDAITVLTKGHKITHKDFMDNEWLEIKNGVITTEDGFDFTKQFWVRLALKDGWSIYKEV